MNPALINILWYLAIGTLFFMMMRKMDAAVASATMNKTAKHQKSNRA